MAFIEVVIEITEKDYKFIKETAEKEPSNLNYIARKILTGTVLPKGHGRLIDADKLKARIPTIEDEYYRCRCWIEHEPTIIEADKGD